ncbi:sodium-dependent transporter [Saccharicrinis sp. FJH54]|uniref:sodium-dependent transporter n=1 Tax=Saccharicrinis sp. FJH54 TaxID=3344665 RepID=UPI0035D3EF2F
MSDKGKSPRDLFGSKLGVIAAAAGSAVGLGNIWKFPYEAGQNGGGAFLLVYIGFILAIGLPIMISEFVIGRKSRANAAGAFKKLAPGKPWFVVGWMGVGAAFMILAFYGVVAGWTLEYIKEAVTNSFDGKSTLQLTENFTTFMTDPVRPIIWQVIFMLLTGGIILGGVKNGIEKYTKILMPLLLIIIIVMGIKSLSLPGGGDGLKFLFSFQFEKINSSVLIEALGQAFFSLSLGMGAIITYGSYVDGRSNLTRTALQVTFVDTLIAVLAGVAIFPAVFAFGIEPSFGEGLVFVALPSIFEQMSGGYFWGILFFVLLAVAALTSTISLLEVIVAYLSEEFKIKRKTATITGTVIVSFLGALCSLSLGAGSDILIFGQNFFGLLNFTASNVLLPLGGMLIALFLGWQIKRNDTYEELSNGGTIKLRLFRVFLVIIKFIAPIAIAMVFLHEIGLLKLNA